MNDMPWWEVWRMSFYRIDHPDEWQAELSRMLRPPPKEEELSLAARELITDTDVKKPTLRHLFFAVRDRRRRLGNSAPREKCAYCKGDGWIFCIPEHGPYAVHGRMIPCDCSAGKRHLATLYPAHTHGWLKSEAVRGRRQIDQKREIDEQYARGMEDVA